MEDIVIFGFKAIAWTFVSLSHVIIPLLIGSGVFYAYASIKEVMWAFTWETKRKERVKASTSKPKKSPSKETPAPSREVVSSYSDEYKLPPLPFR